MINKPVLGIAPAYVSAWKRIAGLAEAIMRQAQADHDDRCCTEWAKEIVMQCEIAKAFGGDREYSSERPREYMLRMEKKPGDKVWWVHESRRAIYEGVIEDVTLNEYQGALYCLIYSPAFRLNPHPSVHYSFVFKSKEAAVDFLKYICQEDAENIPPKCMGCRYNQYEENENV